MKEKSGERKKAREKVEVVRGETKERKKGEQRRGEEEKRQGKGRGEATEVGSSSHVYNPWSATPGGPYVELRSLMYTPGVLNGGKCIHKPALV